jgi:hypothetical protein
MAEVIRLDEITKRFGSEVALDRVSFAVPPRGCLVRPGQPCIVAPFGWVTDRPGFLVLEMRGRGGGSLTCVPRCRLRNRLPKADGCSPSRDLGKCPYPLPLSRFAGEGGNEKWRMSNGK